jgi:hypothetical protein
MRVRFRLMLVAVLALTTVAVADAADFTFRVPVSLHKIPAEIKTLGVSVQVFDATWDPAIPNATEGRRVGFGGAWGMTIENGEFSDTLVVSFDASYDLRRRPEEAVYYQVGLALYGPPGYQGGYMNAMALDGPYPYDPDQPVLCDYFGRINEPAPARRKALLSPGLLQRIKK